MEQQKILNLSNEASDSRFMAKNAVLSMINQMQIMM